MGPLTAEERREAHSPFFIKQFNTFIEELNNISNLSNKQRNRVSHVRILSDMLISCSSPIKINEHNDFQHCLILSSTTNIMPDDSTEKAVPLTMEELKEPLTEEERKEADNPFFIKQFTMFIEAFNGISNLSKKQRNTVTEQLRDHVKQRSAVNQAIIQNPDILNTKINPVVIVGLARSGTTMLHRLLSCDPRFVAPMTFEVLQPCPPGRPKNWKDTERYRKAQEYLRHMYPSGLNDVRHIHEVKMDSPDECYFILQAGLVDNGWGKIPAFRKLQNFIWHLPDDIATKLYEHYTNSLKCIYYKGLEDGQVPLLKDPVHTFYIDTYLKAFPKAKFIFPFRNVKDMVGSGGSVLEKYASMTGFEVDKRYCAEYYTLNYYKLSSSRIVKAMKTTSKDRILPVSYSEMVKDPLAVVKEIYANFGWEVTPEMMENMQRHLQENKQHKHGKHTYNLEDFGLNIDDVKECMSEYLEYFGNKEHLL